METFDLSLERLILSNLLFNEDFPKKVLPHLKSEYFKRSEKVVFETIQNFYDKYGRAPTKDALLIDLTNVPKINQSTFDDAISLVKDLSFEKIEISWLVDTTERFCKTEALRNAMNKAITVFDPDGPLPESLPGLLNDALSVTFDNSVGHDYVNDSKNRLEMYHEDTHRIPFDIELLNLITKGGLIKKSLTVLLAGTGVGKSLSMCHFAAFNITQGYNVLYLTAEMPEEQIAKRIDANLMDIPIGDLDKIDPKVFSSRFEATRGKIIGRLIIKEFPTGSAHAGHIRALLTELQTKQGFVPDIIYVDYINLFTSARVKNGSNVNSYTMIKSIAEEMRGLAMEFDCAVVTATQLTRSGLGSTDPSLTDTSESIGLPFTADFMVSMYHGPEDKVPVNNIFVKQLKNRYNDINYYNKFLIGVDKNKMRLFNLEKTAQTGFDNNKDQKVAVPAVVAAQQNPAATDLLKRMKDRRFT